MMLICRNFLDLRFGKSLRQCILQDLLDSRTAKSAIRRSIPIRLFSSRIHLSASVSSRPRMNFEATQSAPKWIHECSIDLQNHKTAVIDIAANVREASDEKRPFRIFHGSTNSTRQNVLDRSNSVDVSMLNRVLRVDTSRKVALVEPNVPMDRLVEATLRHGLVPAVITEFPGITVGGSFAGTAGESSSFKHGFFDRIVAEAEIVLPKGEIIQASDEKHADLFSKIPSTMGTLGITTALEIRLENAKRYVKTTYRPVKSMEEAVSILESVTADPDNSSNDYIDGIMFSKTEGAVITGRSTDDIQPGAAIQRFSRPWDPWYYVHVQDRVRQNPNSETVELIPIAEYLFRYDRGGFWVGRSAFHYFYFPFNRIARWFLDDFMHTRMLYRALHASKNVLCYVVQDCAVPCKTASQFVKYTDEKFGIYPLWLCPLRQMDDRPLTFHPHSCLPEDRETGQPEQMLNIGLWGFGPKNYTSYIKENRALEAKLHEFGGMKWLYSQTYYTEAEFWKVYQREWYDELREKYHATHLPNVWQKVHVDMEKEARYMESSWWIWWMRRFPLAGLWGLWKSMLSGDWKIPRRTNISKMECIRSNEVD
ncbi:24-dehydrocholesterol reductase-like protein precursor [Tothia fuscella]|uniref:Delta(24)-sterol reductase n=1 Tax=Tothia fuscella TaxID=1048955 RepID=A0A9P4U4K3_9PEZI|nr:24-dehydrocholesterol reductase-like protein precursor [Tothia fuscella]